MKISKIFFSFAISLLCLGPLTSVYSEEGSNPSGGDEAVPPRGGKGTIKILTTPEKAQAFLGGVSLGKTPVDTSFETGRHTLTILLNGEELVKERVNIWANKTTLIEKTLKLPYGNLVVTPDPIRCNCRVFIDGEEVGTTKGGVLTINHLEAGTRILKITNGKIHKEQNVDIVAEGTVEVTVSFKKK